MALQMVVAGLGDIDRAGLEAYFRDSGRQAYVETGSGHRLAWVQRFGQRGDGTWRFGGRHGEGASLTC